MRNDCVTLFEYGFSTLRSATLNDVGSIVESIEIKNAPDENNILNITVQRTLKATFSNSDYIEAFTPTISLNEHLRAPIEAGDFVGTITYNIYGTTYSTNLVALNSIERKTTIVQVAKNVFWVIAKIVLWCVLTIIGLLVLLILVRAYNITKRNQRKFKKRIYNARFR